MPIQQVVKYEGDNSTFIWKHPAEDFNTNSQLIVHESQEAIFFLNGQPLDLFGSGKYTLESENIPLLRHIINIPTGGVSALLTAEKDALSIFKGKEKKQFRKK